MLTHPLAELYDGTVDELKRTLTRGELCLIADVMNGTWLLPGLVGQHVLANVADAFALYPGQYEDKWQVEKEAVLGKLQGLPGWHLGVLEVWAARFWQQVSNTPGAWDHDPYLTPGGYAEAGALDQAEKKLAHAADLMEQTKGAFKSKLIAEAKDEVTEALRLLKSL
jgi:hypothetical protein